MSGVDDIEQDNKGFMSKMRDTRRRTKQKMFQKVGTAETTKDDEFEELLELFSKNELVVQKVAQDLKHYTEAKKAMCMAANNLSETMMLLFDRNSPMRHIALSFKDGQEYMENDVRAPLESRMEIQCLEPVQQHLETFRRLKDTIEKRRQLLLDYDSYKRKVKGLAEKASSDPKAMAEKEQKLAQAAEKYNTINDVLIDQLGVMEENKAHFFYTPLVDLMKCQIEFFGKTGASVTKFSGQLDSASVKDECAKPMPTKRRVSTQELLNADAASPSRDGTDMPSIPAGFGQAPPPPVGQPSGFGQPPPPPPDSIGAQPFGQPMGQPMAGQPMAGQPMAGQPMAGQPMAGQPMVGSTGVGFGTPLSLQSTGQFAAPTQSAAASNPFGARATPAATSFGLQAAQPSGFGGGGGRDPFGQTLDNSWASFDQNKQQAQSTMSGQFNNLSIQASAAGQAALTAGATAVAALPAPAAAGNKARALFAYDATGETELSLREGDIISVLKEDTSGWWQGEVQGRVGWFPHNFVEKM